MNAPHDVRVVIDNLRLPDHEDGDAFASAVVAELTRLLSTFEGNPQLESSRDTHRVHVDSAGVSPEDIAAVLAGIVLGVES
ncbi:hypothetical protein [Mycolicibacterium bacteremicum]|uniref:Uncharacterized protein n=1 Tax=Mycolicibacterium bacteremicum TaxID=564198 RepID=A0A1W9Z4I2_MYCBA|nr:hypothetical protein [Mycolicibacterium bacteremicum]MCV7433714.1 hypothetical protein [Mycolicibacterium bacteremicum]ORA07246.1 hypothetical protein BST17_01930 [Mycolicibacterium bacteremicum]